MQHVHVQQLPLANPFAILNSKRLIGKVDKDNSDLPSVIGINCSGGIQKRDAMFNGKTAAGPHLGFVTFGQGYKQTCWYKLSLQWIKHHRFRKICPDIHPAERGVAYPGSG